MTQRDGHVRVLPIHVANKIAAGEVVERPASVVKELVENAIDAGAKSIRVTITQGGRKLVSVLDDGCGMSRDDALLALERQATSKILDVDDIERIDTLGFRGEAMPSIASVSRFTLITRRHDSDEGTEIQVNAGTLADVHAAGCPPGTQVEVRDLFCNVPARRKFLRAYATEESHVRQIFTVHALAHPQIAFTLVVDGREVSRLAPATRLADRVSDLFGADFLLDTAPLDSGGGETTEVRISGLIEKPNLSAPTRRDQYVFVNGRPASAPSVAHALREAYPRRAGEVRPAAIIFINLPPNQVDVNVHPTKREVRFRDNTAVKQALMQAIASALTLRTATPPASVATPSPASTAAPSVGVPSAASAVIDCVKPSPTPIVTSPMSPAVAPAPTRMPFVPEPSPLQVEFAVEPDSDRTKPWLWFKFLAQAESGYLLIETDSGIVTVNPIAARERIAYEHFFAKDADATPMHTSQALLIPETIKLSPVEFQRVKAALDDIRNMGFQIEEFGGDTFKIDAVPQMIGSLAPVAVLATIARDLSEPASRRAGARWREELIARSIARSFAGSPVQLTPDGACRLVEELSACRMPYVCPRGKPVMIFTSTRELNRKFDRA